MRHGGGPHFIWWIDSVIINEIAKKFNGIISDDGVGEKWKPEENWCHVFEDYYNLVTSHIIDPNKYLILKELETPMIPPEHRW